MVHCSIATWTFVKGGRLWNSQTFLRSTLLLKKQLVLCCVKSAGRDADGESDIMCEGGSEILDLDSSPVDIHCVYFF